MLQRDSLHSTATALAIAERQQTLWSNRCIVRDYCNRAANNIYRRFCDGLGEQEPLSAELFFGAHLASTGDGTSFSESETQLNQFAQRYPLEANVLIRLLFHLPEAVCDETSLVDRQICLPQDIFHLVHRVERCAQTTSGSKWWLASQQKMLHSSELLVSAIINWAKMHE